MPTELLLSKMPDLSNLGVAGCEESTSMACDQSRENLSIKMKDRIKLDLAPKLMQVTDLKHQRLSISK